MSPELADWLGSLRRDQHTFQMLREAVKAYAPDKESQPHTATRAATTPTGQRDFRLISSQYLFDDPREREAIWKSYAYAEANGGSSINAYEAFWLCSAIESWVWVQCDHWITRNLPQLPASIAAAIPDKRRSAIHNEAKNHAGSKLRKRVLACGMQFTPGSYDDPAVAELFEETRNVIAHEHRIGAFNESHLTRWRLTVEALSRAAYYAARK